MNLEELKGRSVLLFGKPRAFSIGEFGDKLAAHGIALADTFGEDVACIVEGAYIDPVDELRYDALYAQKTVPAVGVEKLERALCEALDASRLMMSLKLSGDRERLLGYLRNSFIGNELFLKMLPLYDWQGEGLFDNDENRDVSAALVSRFYENIARDPNVQYVHLGVMQLIAQSRDVQLIETVAMLKPLRDGLKSREDDAMQSLLCLIAEHPQTPARVIRLFVKHGSDAVKALVAARADIDTAMQRQLAALGCGVVTEALSRNSVIDHALACGMLQQQADNIAQYSTLEPELFQTCLHLVPESLAANPSLTPAMQRRLLEFPVAVCAALARNRVLHEEVIRELYAMKTPEILSALAANTATPPQILEEIAEDESLHAVLGSNPGIPHKLLERLAASNDIKTLEAVAQNCGAPYDLLSYLLLDRRLENYIKQNPAFSRNTSRSHIGWMQ